MNNKIKKWWNHKDYKKGATNGYAWISTINVVITIALLVFIPIYLSHINILLGLLTVLLVILYYIYSEKLIKKYEVLI